MRHLKNFLCKIEVHPVTLLYFVLAWLGGYLKWYLSSLLIVCIHEICHLMMAYYFHFDIEKIEILPFGAYLSLNDFYFHSMLEEVCVVLAGPCSHLFIWQGIMMMSNGVYQDYLLQMNYLVLLFNLLPIYPLDGSRIICLFLQRFIDLKKAFYFHLKISVFCLCLFTIFYLQVNTVIIISYLFVQQFYYFRFIPKYLRKYYGQIPTFQTSNKMKLHRDLSYRRGYHNYYQIDNVIYDEKEVIYKLIENVKK